MSALRALVVVCCLACVSLAPVAAASDIHADLVLHGRLDGRDNHTYRSVPFAVPAGVTRITVQFDYTGRDEKTTVDLGLLGPDGFRGSDGFRGWSGGNKSVFTVAATDATPSYLAGPIRPGRWTLLLGIPNIRADAHAEYSARITFSRDGDEAAARVLEKPLRTGPAWFRGDLHMHSAHSDASCTSQSGARVPCPLFMTVKAALARKLDFIAITDHNTVSQAASIRELQPYFDQLLLMPGRELTTFEGHANVFGSYAPIDFRLGSREVPDWNALLKRVAAIGGTFSINHPVRPSDERCMGCGWTPRVAPDYRKVQAVEVVNGLDADTPYSGIPFWQALLDRGYRLSAIGGSDNHDATQMASGAGSGQLGRPTTVVYARELSTAAILDGVRAGHAYVEVAGDLTRRLEFTAVSGEQRAAAGDALIAARGAAVHLMAAVTGVAGGRVEFIADTKIAAARKLDAVSDAPSTQTFDWTSDGRRHWIRADVRDAGGHLALVGNPVYINAVEIAAPARR